jgi:4'-phosphopantetheinyl transferase
MIEVYYANALELEADELKVRIWKQLSKERKKKPEQYRNREDVLRGIAAGALLEYGLNQHNDTLLDTDLRMRQVKLAYHTRGKPYLVGDDKLHFNLSHAGAYAAAAFADAPVGVDIERVERAKEKVAERFFCRDEKEELQRCLKYGREAWQKRFAFLWTRKESYIKVTGEGMRIPLDSFSVLGDSSEEGYIYQTFFVPEGYCISVCSKSSDAAKMTQVDWNGI